MAPAKAPEPTPSEAAAPKRGVAVIFTAGVEVQGFGMVASVNPARMPGARIELVEGGVLVTTNVGAKTFVPYSMVKAVHL